MLGTATLIKLRNDLLLCPSEDLTIDHSKGHLMNDPERHMNEYEKSAEYIESFIRRKMEYLFAEGVVTVHALDSRGRPLYRLVTTEEATESLYEIGCSVKDIEAVDILIESIEG